jgi:hypothetical protein
MRDKVKGEREGRCSEGVVTSRSDKAKGSNNHRE